MRGREENNGGTGILTILLVVFIVLKLTHVIHWSWWLVLSPFWLPAAVVIVFVVAVGLIAWGRKR